MTRAIDTAFFDFGGVIVDSPFTTLDALIGKPGVLRTVNSANPNGNAWAQLERGQIDMDRFAVLFAAEAADLGYHGIDGRAVVDALVAMGASQAHARPAMLAAVQRCRDDGVRTVLVTNNVTSMRANAESSWVYEAFDHVIESCVLGVRKPDLDFYRLALDIADADPPRTVMLDDLGINLKPARALGMHTIKVVDPDVALAELHALLD